MMNCDHINKEDILQLEIRHNQGQAPEFICRMCNEKFNQSQVIEIIDTLNEKRGVR